MSVSKKDLELLPDEEIPESMLMELSNGREEGEEDE